MVVLNKTSTSSGIRATLKTFSIAIVALVLTAGGMSTPAQARTLHYATPAPPIDDPTTDVLRWWADEIERRTDGSIDIEIHWLQSLIKYQEAMQGVMAGIADISPSNPDYTKARNPLWSLSQTELGSGNHYVAAEAWSRVVEEYEVLGNELKRMGLKNLTSYSSGPRVLISSARPYFVPEDFEGDKVRLTPRSVRTAELANWPVTPVNISFAGLYSALGRGTIDGAQSYLTLMLPFKQNEVVEHAVETGIGQSMIVVNMNRRVWNSLSEHEQQVLEEVSAEFQTRTARVAIEEAKKDRETLENHPEHPVELYKLDAEQRAVWEADYQAAVQEHIEQLVQRNPKAKEIHQAFMKALEEVEQEVEENGYPWTRD